MMRSPARRAGACGGVLVSALCSLLLSAACRSYRPPDLVSPSAILAAARREIGRYAGPGYRAAIRLLEPLVRNDPSREAVARLSIAYALLAREQKEVGVDNLDAWTRASFSAGAAAETGPTIQSLKAQALVALSQAALTPEEYRIALQETLAVSESPAWKLTQLRDLPRQIDRDRLALALLQEVFARDPDDLEALLWRWWIQTPGDTDAEDGQILLRRAPTNVLFRFEIGRRIQRGGDLREAERLFLELVAAEPTHAQALGELGQIALARGDLVRARAFLGRAIELDSSLPSVHLALGSLSWEVDANSAACEHWTQAHALVPGWEDPLYNLALMALSEERWAEAVGPLDEVIDLGGRFESWAYAGRSRCALREGRDDQADADAAHALALAPDTDAPEVVRGLVSLHRRQPREARGHFLRAAASNPKNVEARLQLAELYVGDGMTAAAERELSAAITPLTTELEELDERRRRETEQGHFGTARRLGRERDRGAEWLSLVTRLQHRLRTGS